jgi:hypothetical protein
LALFKDGDAVGVNLQGWGWVNERERTRQLGAIQSTLIEFPEIVAYAAVNEAWCIKRDPGVDLDTVGRPSQAEDRLEVVNIAVVARDGRSLHRIFKIVRPQGGAPYLDAWPSEQSGAMFAGELAQLFPPPRGN